MRGVRTDRKDCKRADLKADIDKRIVALPKLKMSNLVRALKSKKF